MGSSQAAFSCAVCLYLFADAVFVAQTAAIRRSGFRLFQAGLHVRSRPYRSRSLQVQIQAQLFFDIYWIDKPLNLSKLKMLEDLEGAILRKKRRSKQNCLVYHYHVLIVFFNLV